MDPDGEDTAAELPEPVNYADWLDSAKKNLAVIAETLRLGLLTSLSTVPARWHPNGFAVFQLGDLGTLGRLRLHIWPTALPRPRAQDSSVHSHAWNLCSLVVGGRYSETLYDHSSEPSSGASMVNSFNIAYADDPDRLEPGPTLWLRQLTTESYARGEFHTVAAGRFHRTVIAQDQFAATLLITSSNVTPFVSVVSEQHTDSVVAHSVARPEVDMAERTSLAAELSSHLS
jgi:hypothetical protein